MRPPTTRSSGLEVFPSLGGRKCAAEAPSGAGEEVRRGQVDAHVAISGFLWILHSELFFLGSSELFFGELALLPGEKGLGCHLHKRMSGTIWERERRRVYFLNRWPSQRAMKRVRQRVRELTPRSRCHADIREVIRDLNPVLRGWGNYFRTGNASRRFVQIDRYVVDRLRSLRLARTGRNLRPGEVNHWTRESFENLGLHRLRGTITYPEQPFWKQEAA